MEVHLHRYSRLHSCSLFIAIDLETSSELLHPFAHPADSNSASSVSRLHQRLARTTLPSIAHRQLEPAPFAVQRNLCNGTSRMAEHVRQPFLHNAEDRNLHLVATPSKIWTHIQHHANPAALCE